MACIAARFNGFPQEAFDFFHQLTLHNDCDWFHTNQEVYRRACREPMEQLVRELGENASSTKITRINRDVRFSRDKSPYRTYIAAGVRGNYIHLSAAGLYVGTGIYKPESVVLERFRKAVDGEVSGRRLQSIVMLLRRKGYRVETHERLMSAPRGYSADHVRIEFLRMEDIFGGKTFPPEPWLSTRKALRQIRQTVKDVRPLAEWIEVHVAR